MKHGMSLCAALLTVGSLSLSGCATLFSGGSGSSQVTSDPEGAKCQVGAYTVVTPGPVTVKHSASPVQVICKKEGYDDGYATLDSDFNPVAIANLIFILPWIVDLATGNAGTHADAVNVVLAKKATG